MYRLQVTDGRALGREVQAAFFRWAMGERGGQRGGGVERMLIV